MRTDVVSRSPGTSLRARILAIGLVPSLSLMLVGLGAAAYNGYRGYQAATTGSGYVGADGAPAAGGPAAVRTLLQALRTERLQAGEVLGDPGASADALRAQWAVTDAAAAALATALPGDGLAVTSTSRFAAMRAQRTRVATRSVGLTDALDAYSQVIVEIDSLGSTNLSRAVPDPRVVREDEISNQLRDLTEALSVGDALSFAAFSGAGLSGEAYRSYARSTGDFQALLRRLQPSLPPAEAAELNRLTTGTDGEVVSVVQRSILFGAVVRSGAAVKDGDDVTARGIRADDVRVTAALPVPRADWRTSASRLAKGLAALQDKHLVYSAGIARDAGQRQFVMALVGSLVLLLFAIAVLVVSLGVSRGLIGRLRHLREETLRLSRDRLPELVQRLRDGEDVDVARELPPIDRRADEIGQVAEAFGRAQRTAVTAAAQEAELRAGLRTVFLDIARRSQAIVYRQLKLLDQAERGQEDPDQLALLFELDHLSTRARRNAENLIILGGGQVGRKWRDPVALRDLVRSAVSEAKDYSRVTVARLPAVTVAVAAVADLIHLLAELVDNATAFSPPESRVEVRGNVVGKGVVIEIEDQGLGLDPAHLARFNQLLHEPPDFQVMALAREPRLGLFVVSQLASRHGIRVTLTQSSAYGGTKVVVLVPGSLLLTAAGTPEVRAPRELARSSAQAAGARVANGSNGSLAGPASGLGLPGGTARPGDSAPRHLDP